MIFILSFVLGVLPKWFINGFLNNTLRCSMVHVVVSQKTQPEQENKDLAYQASGVTCCAKTVILIGNNVLYNVALKKSWSSDTKWLSHTHNFVKILRLLQVSVSAAGGSGNCGCFPSVGGNININECWTSYSTDRQIWFSKEMQTLCHLSHLSEICIGNKAAALAAITSY